MGDYELQPFSNKPCIKCGSYNKVTKTYYSSANVSESSYVVINQARLYVKSFDEFLLCECGTCGYQWLSKVYESD